jgi:hypothetical protein
LPEFSSLPVFPNSLTDGQNSARIWYHWYHPSFEVQPERELSRRAKSVIVQVYPHLCWVIRCLMFEENTNGGRAVSGSNPNFMEIQVVGVDLAKPSSIWQGGWTNMGR